MSDRYDQEAELWRRLLGGSADAAAVLHLPQATIDRIGLVVPPLLVADCVGATGAVGKPNVDYGRYLFSRQLQVLHWLRDGQIDVIAMKGFAAALCDWPDPGHRVIGDLDLLVRRADLKAVVDLLWRRGFRFGSALKTRWGFLPDASFVPFFSPDRLCNVDLHVEPDSYPLHMGLDGVAVFGAAITVDYRGLAIRVPSAEHALLIAVSNLAKDKFPLTGARKLIDIARLLRRPRLDWQEIEQRAHRARLGTALQTSLALLAALGGPIACVPPRWTQRPRGWRRAAWEELLQQWRAFAPTPHSALQLLRREWMLAAAPPVALRLALRRLRGLWRPQTGLPDGVAAQLEARSPLADGSTGP